MKISYILSTLALASSVHAEHINNSKLRGALQQLSSKPDDGSTHPSPAKAKDESLEKKKNFDFFPDDKDEMNEEDEGEDATDEEEEKRLYNDNSRRNRNGRFSSSSSISFDGNGNRRNRADRRQSRRTSRRNDRNFSDSFSSRSSRGNRNFSSSRSSRGNRNFSSSRSFQKPNAAQKRQNKRDNRRTRDNPSRRQYEEDRERDRKFEQSRSRNNRCADPNEPGCGNDRFPGAREAKRSVICRGSGRNCDYSRSARNDPNPRRRSDDRGCVDECRRRSGNTQDCVDRRCGGAFAFE